MKAIFLKELKMSRKGLFIWSIVMLILATLGAAEYQTVVGTKQSIAPVINMMPRIVRIMFGVDVVPIDTPLGYYVCMLLWYSMLAFVHAAFLGATIIVKEEQGKTAEYFFTKPYSRSTIITAKILVAVVNVSVITVISWIATIAFMVPQIKGDSIQGEIVITMFGMFLTQLVFLVIGLMFSAVFKRYKTAMNWSLLFVVASYSIAIIIEYIGTVDYLNFLSPFRYFNAPSLLKNGFDLLYIFITTLVIAVSIYITYFFYNKRDMHS